MDPDEALKKLRVMSDYILTNPHANFSWAEIEWAETFQALDIWMSQGGFRPRGWNGS